MPEDYIECESFTVISIDSLLVYNKKYYLQEYLDNRVYKVVNKQMTDTKSSSSKECMICHYWFFNHGFKFQGYVCNGGHDLKMQCLNISHIAIITIKRVDYSCIIHNISKSEAINTLKNSVLEDSGYM